jgi:alcohol dehydrogenase class IV
MSSFEFSSVAKIIFGRGKIAQLGELARGLGSIALMIHNGDDPGKGGPVDRAAASMGAAGVGVQYHRQRGEPTIADVDAGLAAARQHGCDVIIGLGGGSAIDAAKAVAGLLTNGGAAIDYMEVIGKGKKITKPAAPWIAVPTTAGTGAEVTKNAVIGSPGHRFKASIRGEQLLARVALVDAELGVNVPAEVTAASGMDALCQLLESNTSTGASAVTDTLAEGGVKLALGAIGRAYRDGNDVEAREEMALAALLSGMTLTNAGLGAVHGFAAPLGANFPVPHGVICARLLPLVVAANREALRGEADGHPVIEKYERLGDGDLVEVLGALVAELRIPRLGQYGLREEHIPPMAALARKTSSMKFNPVVLSDEVLAGVLRAAL